MATANTPDDRSPVVAMEITTEVSTTPINATLQQEEHDDDEGSGGEKDEETQPEVMHKDTQEIAPSDTPAVEQVINSLNFFLIWSPKCYYEP